MRGSGCGQSHDDACGDLGDTEVDVDGCAARGGVAFTEDGLGGGELDLAVGGLAGSGVVAEGDDLVHRAGVFASAEALHFGGHGLGEQRRVQELPGVAAAQVEEFGGLFDSEWGAGLDRLGGDDWVAFVVD